MNFLKQFFHSVWLASTSPTHYHDLRNGTWGRSLQYFLLLACCITIITLIPIVVLMSFVNVSHWTDKAIEEMRVVYPSELVLTFEDGRLSTNQSLPYTVPFPQRWIAWFHSLEEYEDEHTEITVPEETNFMVFVRDEDITLQAFEQFDAPILAGETFALINNEHEGEMHKIVYADMEVDAVIDKARVDEGLDYTRDFLRDFWLFKRAVWLPLLSVIIGLFIFIGATTGRLIQIFFLSIVTWILAKVGLSDGKYRFGEIYRLSLHSFTPVLLLHLLTEAAGYDIIRGSLFFLLYLAWTLYVLYYAQKPAKTRAKPKKKR